ncbi:hypothetical protein LguiB_036239 [Lonicera macranthoides]
MMIQSKDESWRSKSEDSNIGKHWMDLTRLLPHTFEELEEDKRSLGKWTISFKLTGKAKVSKASSTDQFGDFCWTSGGGGSGGGGSDSGRLRRLGSVPMSMVLTSEIETIDVAEIFKGDEEMESNSKGNLKDDYEVDGENSVCTQESTIEEVESIFHDLSIFESALLESSIDKKKFLKQESFEQSQMDMDFNSEPDSPRKRLLRQFEKDYIASGNPIFNFEEAEPVEMEFTSAASTRYTFGDCTEDFDFQSAEKESDRVSQSLRSRKDAKILENLETQALMQQWGLNEKAFQYSPQTSSGGFGSPICVYPEEPPELTIIGKGLGPIVQTKGGGFLRSMSPLLFKNAKNGESLIMQVSCPVVLPKAMGSSGIEILQCWALVGIEKMSMQINDLMPLDDITGKTIP